MLPLGVLAVLALASYRATRLMTDDTLTLPLRDRLYRWAWDDEHPVANRETGQLEPRPRAPLRTYVYELVTCSWCLGVWVAALLYVLWRWSSWAPVRYGIVVLALAGAQGFVASRRDA